MSQIIVQITVYSLVDDNPTHKDRKITFDVYKLIRLYVFNFSIITPRSKWNTSKLLSQKERGSYLRSLFFPQYT